jgi:hypothetical protein
MPSDKEIHHLETGVPLIVDEHPGGDLPTSKSQSDNDEASSFGSVVFMYGMFAGVVAPLSTISNWVSPTINQFFGSSRRCRVYGHHSRR